MVMTTTTRQAYIAFLLRGWREQISGSSPDTHWRFVLEEAGGERRRFGFGSLEALVEFLQKELGRIDAESNLNIDPDTCVDRPSDDY